MLYHTLAVLLIVFSNVYCVLAGRECITGIDVYAGTGGIQWAQSDSSFKYVFRYKTDSKHEQNIELYDLPGDDMQKNKGDFWILDAPEECVTVDDILDEFYIKSLSGKDGWYVENSITYGEIDGDKQNLILLSHNYAINSWADTSLIPPDDIITLLTRRIARDNCAIQDQCITNVYIMAQTGDELSAGSDDNVRLHLNGYGYSLPNLPGNDMSTDRSDLWKLTADSGIPTGDQCFTFGSVTEVGLVSEGSDGWLIENVMVTVQLASDDYALLAGNRDFNKWSDEENTLELTLKNKCSTRRRPRPCN